MQELAAEEREQRLSGALYTCAHTHAAVHPCTFPCTPAVSCPVLQGHELQLPCSTTERFMLPDLTL